MIDQRVGERFSKLRFAVGRLVVMRDESSWVPFEKHVVEVKDDIHETSIDDFRRRNVRWRGRV